MLLSDTVTVDIVPAILVQNKEEFITELERASTFAPEVQLDIVDGEFAKPACWPFTGEGLHNELKDLALPKVRLELDLMVKEPQRYLDDLMALNPAKIVVHIESLEDLHDVIAHSREHGYVLGIGLGNDTPVGLIHAIDASTISYFQVMGIAQIGVQGQSFDERVFHTIHEVMGCCAEHPVSVDGSVNAATIPELYKAGASRFVVGSAIWGADDPEAAYESLKTLTL